MGTPRVRISSRSKYGAIRTTIDDVTFASKAEARRYGELKLLQQAGKIKNLELQPRYPLTVNGVRIGVYVADYRYFDVEKKQVVTEDCKGVETPLFKWKRRHLEQEYGFKLLVTGKKK